MKFYRPILTLLVVLLIGSTTIFMAAADDLAPALHLKAPWERRSSSRLMQPLTNPLLPQNNGSAVNSFSPQEQATPEPIYLPGQLLLDVSVALDKCFEGYIDSGMVHCGSPPGTDPIPWAIFYPQTIQYFDFSLSTDTSLGIETHLIINDEFPGKLGYRLQHWNVTSSSWVKVEIDAWGQGITDDHGDITGNFDPDWASKVEYTRYRVIYPAGKYRIMVWEEVIFHAYTGNTIGYAPSQGSIKIYAFENTPPPATPTPDPELTTDIRVRVEAAGYDPVDMTYQTNGFEPSSIELWGKVMDEAWNPIPNATVSLPDLGVSTTTDSNGDYQIYVATTGAQPWAYELGWTLSPAGSTYYATPAPTDTPVVTPTPAPADLSIEDAVYILQSIEGANYVALRDIGILVRPYWKGSYPEGIPTGYQFQVTLTFDGVAFPVQTKGPGRDFTWVIPGNVVGASAHTVSVQAEIVGADIVDSDPSNNTFNKTITAYASRPMRLLYVRVKPTHAAAPSMADLNKLARDSISYLRQVYPVHAVRRVPGNYQVWAFIDTRYAVSLAVAKTLLRYNSERCLEYLPDGRAQQKANCTAPQADLAVAAIPVGVYGDVEGWLYGRGSSIWGSWMDKTSQGLGWLTGGGASIDRAAITVVGNPINPAHEIGHHFNLNDEYGDDLGKQIMYGFIWKDGKFIEIASETAEYYNFMGNAGVGWPATQYWVNADTWNHILNQIVSAGRVELPHEVVSLNFVPLPQAAEETFGSAFLVSGIVNQAGQGRIDSVDHLHRYEVLPTDQGDWILEALDATGGTLGLIRFDTYPTDLESEVPFLATLPVSDPDAVAKIQLRTDTALAASVERSPTAPTVNLLQLPDISQQTATISWTAQDPDGDATTSTVYYSPDGGATWHILVQDTTETQVQFDPATIPGGEVQFRIVTNDGFNETTTLLSPITVPDHSPTASIETPAGTDFIEGDAVILQGYGDDTEDGTLPNENLYWFDASNQNIGTGPLLHVQLPPGQHTLTLQAADSAGQYGTASVVVNVQLAPTPGTSTIIGDADSLWLLLAGLGLILLLIGGGIIFLILYFVLRRRNKPAPMRARRAAPQAGTNQAYQDAQGRWWMHDPLSKHWFLWNGSSWQPWQAPTARRIPPPNLRPRRSGSCLLVLIILALLTILIFGGVFLVSGGLIPGVTLPQVGAFNLQDLLKTGGLGLLLSVLGTVALNGGFKAIRERRARVDFGDEDFSDMREVQGCRAVLHGISQVGIGLGLLIAGLALAALALFQQVLPGLGF